MVTILAILPESPLKDEFMELLTGEFVVMTTDSAVKGLNMIDDCLEQISAVLIDLAIEQINGFTFIKAISEEPLYSSIPVIAISDHLPEKEEMHIFEKGYSDLITPPGLREYVARRIHNAIRAKDSFTYTEMERMLRQLPSNIFLKDTEGRYVFATQYWSHVRQDGRHWTIRGKTDMDIRKDKENARKAMEADREIIRTGKGTDYIIEENVDGQQQFLELIKRPVFDAKGNVTGIIALINDVTEQELLKKELEKRAGAADDPGGVR